MQEAITIVLGDDQEIFRYGIRSSLEIHPDLIIVDEVSSIETMTRVVADQQPDLLLLDLFLQNVNTLDAIAHVKLLSPCTHVIILTEQYNKTSILSALRAGTLSCLPKQISRDELVQAVRQAARGEATLYTSAITFVVQEYQKSSSAHSSLSTDLSERELEVLHLVAQGYTNAKIACELIISERTVKSHVSSLLHKLDLADRTQLTVYAWKQGLIHRDMNIGAYQTALSQEVYS